MATSKYLKCNICGNQQPYEPFVPAVCKKCESQWLEVLFQKGSLPTRKFADQVINVIEEANEVQEQESEK